MHKFKIQSKFKPKGDQPKAIKQLIDGVKKKYRHQTLLGVTGSGKTFTVANVIAAVQRPTLVIAPNKTLAAQLTSEFREFFPANAVEYFVSYYDYYQPEAYIASSDTYIEKEAEINKEIDRLRHRATSALMSRRDVIICATVSCIYGLGSPGSYKDFVTQFAVGQIIGRDDIIENLVKLHYVRSVVLKRSVFRAQGNIIEIMPPSDDWIIHIELDGDRIKKIQILNELNRNIIQNPKHVDIFPAKHFVVPEPIMGEALDKIESELEDRLGYFKKHNKFLEEERLRRRTRYDLEMMRQIGYCNGIENYSRFLTGRAAGEAPYTLMDYFPKDLLIVIDESHITIPQLGGMYEGDRSRKTNLVEYGFRLPSAIDNRPLRFAEFESKVNQAIYTTATPGKYELKNSTQVVEQIIRPTGLIDPEVVIRPAQGQIKDLLKEIEKVVARKERVLVTTLTKRMSEDLTEHLVELGIKSRYLHSEVSTLDRIVILEDLRKGKFDVLVGVNLLREGLDLPEVSLIGILDADKEGFLRSETSLIQTMGRAARHIRGRVVLYADRVTGSMKRAISETNRRREIQKEYNTAHHITPASVEKSIKSIIDHELKPEVAPEFINIEHLEDIDGYVKIKEKEMREAAKDLEFEKAALIRDEIMQLKRLQLKS
ncbi:MAG: excinuclease ABC subunit UvrB [bacterium]|nr:excinuclease ABC subunit UvrB [bacterium]